MSEQSDDSLKRFDEVFTRWKTAAEKIVKQTETPEGQRRLAEYKAAQKAEELLDLEQRIEHCGVPALGELRAVAAQANPPRTQAVRVVRWALKWRGKTWFHGGRTPLVLVLSGRPGCGKSCAAAWAVVHERSTLFLPASRIASTADNGYSDNTVRWERWRSVGLLVIDELGDETNRPEVCERITTLISDRYNDGRATIVTTNVGLDAFSERYLNQRLVSRLHNAQAKGARTPRDAFDRGGCPWWVDCEPVDYRAADARAALEGGAQ